MGMVRLTGYCELYPMAEFRAHTHWLDAEDGTQDSGSMLRLRVSSRRPDRLRKTEDHLKCIPCEEKRFQYLFPQDEAIPFIIGHFHKVCIAESEGFRDIVGKPH